MTLLNFKDLGGIEGDPSPSAQWFNGGLLNYTLSPQNMTSGTTLLIPPGTFHVMGGIVSAGLQDVKIQIDGALEFSSLVDEWPRKENGQVLECLQFNNVKNFTVTSSLGGGTPHRLKIRAPSFVNLSILSHMVPGHMMADVVAILGSLDFVMGECDR